MAIARGVERLVVTTIFRYEVPVSVLLCQTLIDLEINSFYGVSIIRLPIFRFLRKLKVPFTRCDTESFKWMVSQCSSLKHLIVNSYGRGTRIDIVSSSLKRLELCYDHCGGNKKILLDVRSLEYLKIFWEIPPELIVTEELSSLINADIWFCVSTWLLDVTVQHCCDSFVRLIQPLSNVKILRLNYRSKRIQSSIDLTELDSSNSLERRLLDSLMEMESSINLEALTWKRTHSMSEYKSSPSKEGPTFLSSFRKITICGCNEDKLPMANHVLRSAQSSQLMDIKLSNDMLQEMLKFQRAMEKCEISIVRKL